VIPWDERVVVRTSGSPRSVKVDAMGQDYPGHLGGPLS
jgi:hypothetical protein